MSNWREWVKQHSKIALFGSVAIGIIGVGVFNVVETLGSIIFLIGGIGVIVTLKITRPPKAKKPNAEVDRQTGTASPAPLKSSPVLLKEGEVVLLSEYALRYITKNRVVGHTGGIAGVSVPIGGGVRARVGGVKGHSVYGDVTNSHRGEFVLTNQRMVFVASQRGFEFKLDKVSAITAGDDNTVVISTAQDTAVMHIVPNLKPKVAKKFMSGDLKKFPCSLNADRVLSGLIARSRT